MAGPRPPQQWRGLLAIVVWCVAAFLYTHPQRHVDEVKNHWQSLQRPAAPQWYEPAWSAATPAPTAAPRARIVRTARSAAERFVYLAGLEHTGHHLWHRSLFPGLKFGQGISSVARVVLELVRSHSGARSADTIAL